jgi:transcriptional regulator with XRE-family HTH domain
MAERRSELFSFFLSLPELLIKKRIANEWTLAQLAERLGLHHQQIQRYESTDYATATFETMQRVAAALNQERRAARRTKLAVEVPSGAIAKRSLTTAIANWPPRVLQKMQQLTWPAVRDALRNEPLFHLAEFWAMCAASTG